MNYFAHLIKIGKPENENEPSKILEVYHLQDQHGKESEQIRIARIFVDKTIIFSPFELAPATIQDILTVSHQFMMWYDSFEHIVENTSKGIPNHISHE